MRDLGFTSASSSVVEITDVSKDLLTLPSRCNYAVDGGSSFFRNVGVFQTAQEDTVGNSDLRLRRYER